MTALGGSLAASQEMLKSLAGHSEVETGALPVRFVGVGTYSLDVEIFTYVLTRDGDKFLQLQQDLLLQILDNVGFSFR